MDSICFNTGPLYIGLLSSFPAHSQQMTLDPNQKEQELREDYETYRNRVVGSAFVGAGMGLYNDVRPPIRQRHRQLPRYYSSKDREIGSYGWIKETMEDHKKDTKILKERLKSMRRFALGAVGVSAFGFYNLGKAVKSYQELEEHRNKTKNLHGNDSTPGQGELQEGGKTKSTFYFVPSSGEQEKGSSQRVD